VPRLTAIVAILCLAASLTAAPHRLRVHPNPSITILSITQGPDGFLWLAAEDGLYRFDGLHYQKIRDFPFASARFVAFTSDGALWAAGREGLARYQDHFEVILREAVKGMAALPDQVYVSLDRLASVHLDRSVHRLGRVSRPDLMVDPTGRLWSVCTSPFHACSFAPGQPDEEASLPEGFDQVVRDSHGQLWAADQGRAVALRNGKESLVLERRPSNKTERPGPLVPGRNGSLWFLGETIRNLTTAVELRDRQINERFQPTAGYEDSHGHFWVARLGQGLVEWIPEPAWQRWFPESFGQESAAQILRTRQGTHIAATSGNLYRLESPTANWSALTTEPRRYAAVLALDGGGFLASIRKFGLARLSPDGRVLEQPRNPLPSQDQYRQILRDYKGRIWVGDKLALLRLEGHPGTLHLEREELPRDRPGEEMNVLAVDLELDAAGHLWVGYEQGIAWLDQDDRWHKLSTEPPVDMVRSLALRDPFAGEDIWVAYRRSGAFTRLERKGAQWIGTDFAAGAGYEPVDTHFLKRDSRGWIWRGSPAGVHISDSRSVSPNDWIHIDLQNGLATDTTGQYGFFEDVDGSVWIAGEEGVSHIKPDTSWFDAPHAAPPPRVTSLEADGRVYLHPADMPDALPANTNLVRIEVGSLDTPEFRDYPLRYRLKPLITDWKLSRDGGLEFRRLPENAYTLEVAYTGNGSADTLLFPFRVGVASEWLSWRWLLGFPLAGSAVTLIVRRAPWFRRTNYWLSKSVFLMRRRLSYWDATAPPATPDYSGEILFGRYQLVQPVSRSGFSVVYEARDLDDGAARVAVKVLLTKAGNESWVRDHFAQEVAALRSIQLPGVVPIRDSWISTAGEPCLAMPFLDGPTLRAALESGPLPPRRVARIVRQLGFVLSEIHHRGIVHRDLKPENLILLHAGTDEEQAVLIDFGTAGLRGGEHELAATTLLAGSFRYLPPERLTGHYCAASDVYAFAVIVLEALTGKAVADLGATYSDPAFRVELERALDSALVRQAAQVLAEHLYPAYHPEPKRRPNDVIEWAETVAALLLADRPST
jgi:ligand-binding sensor domain-containing protein